MLLEVEKPVLTIENADERHGKYRIEPLERGCGITLGNSLRRILLSALPGAAVTHVKIEGVLHEFSTIPGVVEDTTEITLNLKKLRMKMHPDSPRTLRLEVKGERKVTAGDITPDAEIEVLSKDLHIATLSEPNSRLSMEMRIEKGKGYVPAERHRLPEQIIGLIPVDSIFTPVIRVNYVVEDTRVGQVTDFDRLILEIWTDGSIHPSEAVSTAATILQSYMRHIETDLMVTSGPSLPMEDMEPMTVVDMPIEELGLSVRSLNCLRRAGVRIVNDLIQLSDEDVMKLKNFGQKSLDEIQEKLAQYNLALKVSLPEEIREG